MQASVLGWIGQNLPLFLLLAGAGLTIAEAFAPGAHFMVLGVALLVAGLVVTACTLAVVFVNVDPTDRRERFATALVTVLVAVVALPTGQNSYTFYAVPGLVVALFVVSGRWPRALVGGGFALLAVPLDPEELLRLRDVAAPGAVPAVFAALETMLTVASVELYGFALAVAGLALFVGVPRWRG